MPARSKNVLMDLLEAVAGRALEDADALLDELTDTDPELRRETRELLHSRDEIERFMETPIIDNVAFMRSLVTREPSWIGPFKVLRKLGEGGMGTVYLAQQDTPVRRRVALKIIKGSLVDDHTLARFEAERQALAMMSHPSIARVYDGGDHEGRPYFTMEYVPSLPIDEFCHLRALSLEERLEIFGQAAEAVSHAHQRGILHRDLKPSNVLVRELGSGFEVKVIDFGLAKALNQNPLTDRTLVTRPHTVIGTPMYMSPEQITSEGLDVDVRTDVYAMGCILYELLTGTPVFDPDEFSGKPFSEKAVMVRTTEPPPPSKRVARAGTKPPAAPRSLRGELDWITAKSLAKVPRRRYQSMEAFLADLHNHALGYPVAAGPPTLRYRLGKLIARHRRLLLQASITLVLVASVALWGWHSTRAQRDKAREATEIVRAINSQLEGFSDLVGTFLSSPDPYLQPTRADATRRVIDMITEAERQLASYPDSLDEPYLQATITLNRLGAYESATTYADKGLALFSDRVLPSPEIVGELAYQKAYALKESGALNEAERTARGLSERIDAKPKMSSMVRCLLAEIAYLNGRYAEAITSSREVLQLPGIGTDIEMRATLTLANGYQISGDFATAEPHYRRLVEYHALAHGDDHPETLSAMENLAVNLMKQREIEEAETLLRTALSRREARMSPFHPETMRAKGRLGEVLLKANRLEEAEQLLTETMHDQERLLGRNHRHTMITANDLALVKGESGKPMEKVDLLSDLLEDQVNMYGIDHRETTRTRLNLANGLTVIGREAEGERLLRMVVRTRQERNGPTARGTLTARGSLAENLLAQGRHTEAEALLCEIGEIAFEHLQMTDTLRLIIQGLHGRALVPIGPGDEAERCLIGAINGLKGSRSPYRQSFLNDLLGLYDERKDARFTQWERELSAILAVQ